MTTEQFLSNLLDIIKPDHLPLNFNIQGIYQRDGKNIPFYTWNYDQIHGTPLNPLIKDHQFTFYLIPSTLSILSYYEMDIVTNVPQYVIRTYQKIVEINLKDSQYWDTLLTYKDNMKILVPSQALLDLLQ